MVSKVCACASLLMTVSPCCFRRIVDSYIRAIDLLLGSSAHDEADIVLMVRFEGSFRVNLDHMNIDWTLVNFAFRDSDDWWQASRLASDLFFVFPSWHLSDMRSALDQSGNTPQQWPGSAHFTWGILADSIGTGRLHFIDNGGQCAFLPRVRL